MLHRPTTTRRTVNDDETKVSVGGTNLEWPLLTFRGACDWEDWRVDVTVGGLIQWVMVTFGGYRSAKRVQVDTKNEKNERVRIVVCRYSKLEYSQGWTCVDRTVLTIEMGIYEN
jgi:hypothetical protein